MVCNHTHLARPALLWSRLERTHLFGNCLPLLSDLDFPLYGCCLSVLSHTETESECNWNDAFCRGKLCASCANPNCQSDVKTHSSCKWQQKLLEGPKWKVNHKQHHFWYRCCFLWCTVTLIWALQWLLPLSFIWSADNGGAETLRGFHSSTGHSRDGAPCFHCTSSALSTLAHSKQLFSLIPAVALSITVYLPQCIALFSLFPCSMSHNGASGDLLCHSAKSPHPAQQFPSRCCVLP